MTPILENAFLSSDLDCQNFDIKNVGLLDPVPEGLVEIDDVRLKGGRNPPAGSVTNDSVNATAAIDQSKLNLNGPVPDSFFYAGGDVEKRKAAKGELAEFVSRKGAPNGYAALDADGKVAPSAFTPGDAVGSITSIGMRFKNIWSRNPMTVHPQTITTSGIFNVTWLSPTVRCWFGSDGTLDPQHHEFTYPFFVTHTIEVNMVSIPASKFNAGVVLRARLPLARGVGVPPPAGQTRIGMAPDPGHTGGRNMYLGRDMNWHQFHVNDPARAHQPQAPDVTITLDWWEASPIIPAEPLNVKAHVTIRSLLRGSFLFYRVTPFGDQTPDAFQRVLHPDTPDDIHISIEVNDYDTVEAYAAKQGYNNSEIEEWTVITPISDLKL
jgi:hypothetical protein